MFSTSFSIQHVIQCVLLLRLWQQWYCLARLAFGFNHVRCWSFLHRSLLLHGWKADSERKGNG